MNEKWCITGSRNTATSISWMKETGLKSIAIPVFEEKGSALASLSVSGKGSFIAGISEEKGFEELNELFPGYLEAG